jgi:hypothetical protein
VTGQLGRDMGNSLLSLLSVMEPAQPAGKVPIRSRHATLGSNHLYFWCTPNNKPGGSGRSAPTRSSILCGDLPGSRDLLCELLFSFEATALPRCVRLPGVRP